MGRFLYLRIACDLSWPNPLRRYQNQKSRTGGLNGETPVTLPGGMTILEVPRPIIVDVNRIGYNFNIVRVVVTDEIGENRADKGLHTTADDGENRRISAA